MTRTLVSTLWFACLCACAARTPAAQHTPAWHASSVKATSSDAIDPEARIRAIHGGAGPWVVAGYKMGAYALRAIGLAAGSFDVEVRHYSPAEVQYSCIADGAAAATGASLGKLNLNRHDVPGPQTRTVYRNKKTGRSIVLRVTPSFAARYSNVPRAQLGASGREVLALPDADVFEVVTLAGRIYDVRAQAFVSHAQLATAIGGAEFVVLGESHDNPEHHLLEAQFIEGFLDAHFGANPAIAFEMLDEDDRAALAEPPADANALAYAVDWEHSGWPDFSQYSPVFEVAIARSARLVAAHPSAEHVHESLIAIPVEEQQALLLNTPLAEPVRAALRDEIRESHCGHAPPAMLDAMERAQSYKDAFMARSLTDARGPAVLVTGRGHARNDRAVPYFLRARGAASVVSIAIVEANEDQAFDTRDVSAFDFVAFTAHVEEEDPCVRYRNQLQKLKGLTVD